MNKAAWIVIGLVFIIVAVFLAIPQGGIDWSQQLIDFFKGAIVIALVLAGLFAFLMAKLE